MTDEVFEIKFPDKQEYPVVLSSPHSGNHYSEEFLKLSRLDLWSLRCTEDCFVDKLYDFAPDIGIPLLCAKFPRAYIDANREPFELDQSMFGEKLPDYVNTNSKRVKFGLGTIPKIVGLGQHIYADSLLWKEAKDRIEKCYFPYHQALRDLIEKTKGEFGRCLLIDCHSMPSSEADDSAQFVLGDFMGKSCDKVFTEKTKALLENFGYEVGVNTPYAGGFTTEYYGTPDKKIHVLQIEISRELYMDEKKYQLKANSKKISSHLEFLIKELSSII